MDGDHNPCASAVEAIIDRHGSFSQCQNIQPAVEQLGFDRANEAIAHFESGEVRYHVVLSH